MSWAELSWSEILLDQVVLSELSLGRVVLHPPGPDFHVVQYETFVDRADRPRPICRAGNLFFRFSFITNIYYSSFFTQPFFLIFKTVSNSKKVYFIKNDVFIDSFWSVIGMKASANRAVPVIH